MQAWLVRALLTGLVGVLTSCSTHFSTARVSDGRTALYAIPEDQALQIAHQALSESFPGRRITELTGPSWGFATSFRFMLDTYSQQVLVVPMEGRGPTGELVRGVAFDVSGSGTAVISGSARNRQLFSRLRRLVDATGALVTVTEAVPVKYGQLLLNGKAAKDRTRVQERLRELKSLRDTGLISPEQFEEKQREILKDL